MDLSLRCQLREAAQRLVAHEAGRLEAEVLLAHVIEAPRSFLYANPEFELPRRHIERFHELVRRRADGEPIAYLTGEREFWSLKLRVSPGVLIPRHETELLVECALEKVPADAAWRIADLGTGSGAIALALAAERSECAIFGSDISPAAVELARDNAARLEIDNVLFALGSWCKPLQGAFELVVSNPPYVAPDDPHLQRGDCRFEPRAALTPGGDAMAAVRELCSEVPARLRSRAWLMVEHGAGQGDAVRGLMAQAGFAAIESRRDLAGHERVTIGQWDR